MARADLLKKLFSSYSSEDRELFSSAAKEIIDDERHKNHAILANELDAILNNKQNSRISNNKMLNLSSTRDDDNNSQLVEVIYPDKYLNDLIMSAKEKNIITNILREYVNWDVLASNGAHPSSKILFYGPPGCGKTITANAIAGELGIPLIYVRFDAVVSSFLGETASNLKKVFDYAKNDNWVLFFDEFDAIARSRDDSSEHGEIKRVVNTFLQQIDTFKGHSLVIAATNYEKSLDYAIWRRFDETLNFEMPDHNQILDLIKLNLNKFQGPVHLFDQYLSELEDFSHSDVEKMTNTIIKNCILNGKRMYSKSDIEDAANRQKEIVKLRKTSYTH